MAVRRINPVADPRWKEFIDRHPRATVFHTPSWLTALQRTYGYEPEALTTAGPGGPLNNGFVFCRIKSWLTGNRLVSLPFSDHCDILADTEVELECLLNALKRNLSAENARFLELRAIEMPAASAAKFSATSSFCLHKLDLNPNLDELFHATHKSCIQRKIQRADRDGLMYEAGASEKLLMQFYRLQIVTRRRHGLAPQPLAWFRNLIACMGHMLKIRVASKDGEPVAGMLTLQYKDTLVYKYGCSDARFHNSGSMPLLFWRAIEDAKAESLKFFDLGRSDWQDDGVIKFKDRWGAKRSELTYLRSSAGFEYATVPASSDWKMRIARIAIQHLPDWSLRAAGQLMYRHIG